MTIGEIELKLRKLGYTNFKNKTSNRISIVVDGDRSAVLRKVAEIFKDQGAIYNPNYQTPVVNGRGGNQLSSVGVVKIGDKIVFTRPLSKQGNKSAGVASEISFVNGVNKYLDTGYGAFHTITVIFNGSGRTIVVDNVLIAEYVGSKTSDGKKSDVNLIRLNAPTFKISLKKSNAQIWESARSSYGFKASSIMDSLEKSGDIKLIRTGTQVKFGPGITGVAIPTSDSEKTDFIFGSDILGNGAVVKQTFLGDNHFIWNEEKLILTVNCLKLYDSLSQIKYSNEDPFILIRTGSDRSLDGSEYYKGLRVQAVYKSRLVGSVKQFPRSKFNGII
jgi:hypothetical protein